MQGERRGHSFSEMKATSSGFGGNVMLFYSGTVFLYGTLAALHSDRGE